MAQRGRKSAAELAVVKPVTEIQRPDAPYDLADEQSGEWWAIVNSMPADWFPRETHGALAQLCRHIVRARRVEQLIQNTEKGDGFDVEEYDRLGKMAERESRIIASLMTKLRITQQTRVDKSKKRGPVTKPPWE